MPAFLAQAAALVGGVLVTMTGQLLTAGFVKHLVICGLEVVVKKTKTDVDNQLLDQAKAAWQVS